MQKSLTTGSVLKNIVCFSLPYLLSYFLQTLYGMADLFIIGQYEGVASTTSVSIGSQVMHVLTIIMVGLTMGSTVSIGQAVGAKQHKKAAACIGNTVTLFCRAVAGADDGAAAVRAPDYPPDGDARGCRGGHGALSYHLLPWHSLHYGV